MGIALKILKSAPSWAVCDPIKLLAINNRLSEAMDTLHFDDMALTKLEKFLMRRAFAEIRKAKRREELKEWALHYALTGEDTRRAKYEKEILRSYNPLPGSFINATVPQNGVNKVTLNQVELQAILEGQNNAKSTTKS